MSASGRVSKSASLSIARRALRFAAAVLLLAPLACGRTDDADISVGVVGAPTDPFATSVRLPLGGQLVRAATVAGLVAFDEKGRVVPALADRWIVTDDGQSYIFRLRDGDWRDGQPITAKSAKASLDAAIKALRGTPMELDLEGIEEIRVMAARVIEIRLVRPMPYLLQLLAQPELGLVHEGKGGGPMALERERNLARLVPIEPSRLGLPAISDWNERTRQVLLVGLPADTAVERFNDGEVDLVLGGRLQDFPLTSSVGILRGTIQLDPVSGLFGLKVMNDNGFLAEPANREALAMALDREGLIAPFRLDGWSATTLIVPPGLEQGGAVKGGERWAGQSLDERRAVASARVGQWQREHGAKSGGRVTLTIWLPEGPGSDTLFKQLTRDLTTIGITVTRAPVDAEGDLRLIDLVARYPRATWYLNRLSCQARQGLCNETADDLVKQSRSIPDPVRRADLLAEAESELLIANAYIPIGTPVRWSLVRGSVDGFSSNTWGWHPLMPLARLPR